MGFKRGKSWEVVLGVAGGGWHPTDSPGVILTWGPVLVLAQRSLMGYHFSLDSFSRYFWGTYCAKAGLADSSHWATSSHTHHFVYCLGLPFVGQCLGSSSE